MADASVTKVFGSEQVAADRRRTSRDRQPARRPGRGADRRASPVAGCAEQAEHRHDVRRRSQRGAAGADRDGRPEAAAGAAMTERRRQRGDTRGGGEDQGSRAGRAKAGQGSGEYAGDPQLDRRHRRRQSPVHRCRVRCPLGARPAGGAAGHGAGLDDAGAAAAAARRRRRRSARRDDDGAGRGRVHLGRSDELRPDLSPLPPARRAAQPARRADRCERPQDHRSRRRLVRDHQERLVLRRRGGRGDGLAGAEVPAAARAGSRHAAEHGQAASASPRRPAPDVMRPPVSPDTEFFWAGTKAGELRIQRCGECGALRHPPGPACLSCGAVDHQGYQVAAGTGTVYSYVVHRHPPVPGKQLPIIVALVELTEGATGHGRADRHRSGPGAASACRCAPASSGSTTTWCCRAGGPTSGARQARCPSWHCRSRRPWSSPPRSLPATSTRCTTIATLPSGAAARTSSSTSSRRPAWYSGTSPTGRDRRRSCDRSPSGSGCRATPATR